MPPDGTPKLIQNKTAFVLINLFNPRDLNDAIKLEKMSVTVRDRCLGHETIEHDYESYKGELTDLTA